MSHKFVLDVVLKTFEAIIKSLDEIQSQSGDKKAGSEAGGFLQYFQSKRFIYTASCFRVLLEILEPISNLLQKTDLDLTASYLMKKKYEEIVLQRSKKSLDLIFTDAEVFMNSLENIDFYSLSEGRLKKKKRMFDGQSLDETTQ